MAFGPLARLFLIQVHKLKLDTEKTFVVMDQLLRANELNFQALAAIPALLVFGFGPFSLLSPFS